MKMNGIFVLLMLFTVIGYSLYYNYTNKNCARICITKGTVMPQRAVASMESLFYHSKQ
ncbi:MAG: hypothetical protein NTY22_02005 [Proteobacteria bacterium]|nr:hypothetical protein [Pseudomonadota bacterium]